MQNEESDTLMRCRQGEPCWHGKHWKAIQTFHVWEEGRLFSELVSPSFEYNTASFDIARTSILYYMNQYVILQSVAKILGEGRNFVGAEYIDGVPHVRRVYSPSRWDCDSQPT